MFFRVMYNVTYSFEMKINDIDGPLSTNIMIVLVDEIINADQTAWQKIISSHLAHPAQNARWLKII